MPLRTIVNRWGNNSYMSDDILKFFPQHITYVEPFFGAGALYFKKEPSEKEIINDIDKDLIHDYRRLKKVSSDSSKYPQNLNTIKTNKNEIKAEAKTNSNISAEAEAKTKTEAVIKSENVAKVNSESKEKSEISAMKKLYATSKTVKQIILGKKNQSRFIK